MNTETFAQRITKRKLQLELTQRQVASAIGVPLSTYKEWEYGRQIQGEKIYVKLSEVLEMNLHTLLSGDHIENSQSVVQEIQILIDKLTDLKKRLLSSL